MGTLINFAVNLRPSVAHHGDTIFRLGRGGWQRRRGILLVAVYRELSEVEESRRMDVDDFTGQMQPRPTLLKGTFMINVMRLPLKDADSLNDHGKHK